MRKLACVTAVICLASMGCVGDPNDPKTWIKKLDDPRESKEAIRMLVKIKDKSAVPALIEVYKKTRDPGLLKNIATFEDPTAIPLFIDSMEYSEEGYEAASVAASALGDLGAKQGVDALVKAVLKPLPVKTRANVVKLESMKALAKIKDPKAVDALTKVLVTSADEQDFFLNREAALALGGFADPKAVPALVRGLFLSGRGANIFQECRMALVAIGPPAADKLIESMQRKNTELEEDAKKYEYYPGVIVQKTAELLGDLRSIKAVPALLEQLGKPDEGAAAVQKGGKGTAEHETVIQSLGKIGNDAALKPLTAILTDKKKPMTERKAACEGLNVLGDPSVMPLLLAAANTEYVTKKKEIDPEAAQLAAVCAVSYGRLSTEAGEPDKLPKIPPKDEESGEDWFADIRIQIDATKDRIAVAKECKKDLGCYEKHLGDKDENKAEKAAFMLSRMGKEGLGALCRHVDLDTDSGLARLILLLGIQKVGGPSPECVAALDKQIEKDKGKPAKYRMLVSEMRVTRAAIAR